MQVQQRPSHRVRVKLVTAATEKVCLSESLQSWWDNEARPGAPDLRFWFSTVLQTQRDNWQHSFLSIWDASPANVPPACPPHPHPPPPQTHLSQHMAHCLLAHHQCRTIDLALHIGISRSQPRCPPYPHTPIPHPPSAGQVRPTHFLGVCDRTQVQSCAVMAQ